MQEFSRQPLYSSILIKCEFPKAARKQSVVPGVSFSWVFLIT